MLSYLPRGTPTRGVNVAKYELYCVSMYNLMAASVARRSTGSAEEVSTANCLQVL